MIKCLWTITIIKAQIKGKAGSDWAEIRFMKQIVEVKGKKSKNSYEDIKLSMINWEEWKCHQSFDQYKI